ncbi:hypothetical protein CSIV_14370 [Microbacterium sp. CSI-V]|uniref:hypothetical protein n=1 Tax=Microbacterium sp. CSI-V TaxID=1933777 RepID=UPI00097BE04F|nr:hypothetical protein [Microbacterium sp. CSI-V]ONI62656.1 hypothetical protein CSIV_14370 [Microbacterium sp. CSI-V]
MSVKEQMGYALVCDFPGCGTSTSDLGDYAFWGDISAAVDEWNDAQGYSGDLGDYCYEHTVWSAMDEDDEDDERVPMLYTIENLLVLAERRIRERIDVSTRYAMLRHERRCEAMRMRDTSRARRVERPLRDLAERMVRP